MCLLVCCCSPCVPVPLRSDCVLDPSPLTTLPLQTLQFGNPFMARRSYLPHELHWGEQFLPIIMRPEGSESNKHYGVDLTQ